jgi:hypothetical protein
LNVRFAHLDAAAGPVDVCVSVGGSDYIGPVFSQSVGQPLSFKTVTVGLPFDTGAAITWPIALKVKVVASDATDCASGTEVDLSTVYDNPLVFLAPIADAGSFVTTLDVLPAVVAADSTKAAGFALNTFAFTASYYASLEEAEADTLFTDQACAPVSLDNTAWTVTSFTPTAANDYAFAFGTYNSTTSTLAPITTSTPSTFGLAAGAAFWGAAVGADIDTASVVVCDQNAQAINANSYIAQCITPAP